MARGALDAGLGSVGDFFGDEEGEEVAVGETVGFGAGLEFGVESPDGGEVESGEEPVETAEVEVGAEEARKIQGARAGPAGRARSCRAAKAALRSASRKRTQARANTSPLSPVTTGMWVKRKRPAAWSRRTSRATPQRVPGRGPSSAP